MSYGKCGGIVIIGETENGKVLPVTIELIGEGSKIGKEAQLSVSVLLTGKNLRKEAERLSDYPVDEIICVEHAVLGQKHKEWHKKACLECIKNKQPVLVLIGGTTFGRILGAEIAFEMKAGWLSDVALLSFNRQKQVFTASRPAFDGIMMADFELLKRDVSVVTMRPGIAKQAKKTENRKGEVLIVKPDWKNLYARLSYAEKQDEEKKKIKLEDAEIIVAGGRGMKGREGFELLEVLAEKLGAGVGATRPCVDAGWAAPEHQIGQSGILVKPRVYIAFGISGAVQHMMGVRAGHIIGVNSNPDAAIFQHCDYGIVGDANEIIKDMIEKIDKDRDVWQSKE